MNDIVRILFSFGPMSQIKEIISYSNYVEYLHKVDHRNKEINLLASKLTKPCKNGDHVCEVSLILRFVTDEISYRNDPRGRDFIKSPLETIRSRAGDCEAKTILLISLLETLGRRTYMVFKKDHTYAFVCFDTKIEEYIKKYVSRNRDERYILRYAPSPEVLLKYLKNNKFLRIKGQRCYAWDQQQEGHG